MKQREIKFRAWDKKYKEMISNEEFCFSPFYVQADGKVINLDESDKNKFEELDYVLMQYTGLKDRNGKEVYEGDIVEHKFGYTRVIKWRHTNSYVGFGISKGERNEVIGNVYENKDLLK